MHLISEKEKSIANVLLIFVSVAFYGYFQDDHLRPLNKPKRLEI